MSHGKSLKLLTYISGVDSGERVVLAVYYRRARGKWICM